MLPMRRGPNRFREIPYGRLNYVSRRAQFETYQSGSFHLVAGFMSAVNQSLAVNEQVRAFAEALANIHRHSHARNQLAQAHTQVAKLMQQAVLEDYDKAKARYGRNIAPYRLTTRDAGGKLRAALQSNIFYRGTYDGIGFVNVSLLNNTARQWHRLNFGARPAGTYTPRLYQARFGNLVAGSFGYLGEGPSPGFGLPYGFFTREGAFYPRGPRQVIPTRGIRAWNFLDAGPRVLAERIGPAYDGLYRDWYASAQRGKGPLSRVANAPPPRRRAWRP
jgi:hypothetical protein